MNDTPSKGNPSDDTPTQEAAAEEGSSAHPAEPAMVKSEADRVGKRNQLILMLILIVTIGAVFAIRYDQIMGYFQSDDAPKEHPLDSLRNAKGEVQPPISIEVTQGEKRLSLKAERAYWSLESHGGMRVRKGAIFPLLKALVNASRDIAEDPNQVSAPDWQHFKSVEMRFEGGEVLSLKVKEDQVYFEGAREPVHEDGLNISLDPRQWMILHWNLLEDPIPSVEKQIDPIEIAQIRGEHPKDAWTLGYDQKLDRWALASHGMKAVRRRYATSAFSMLQNINILGPWEYEQPKLHLLGVSDLSGTLAKLWLSVPAANDRFAALQLDEGGALYRISATAGRLLLPSLADLEDNAFVPPAEGSEESYVGYRADVCEIILIAHQGCSRKWAMLPADPDRTGDDAYKMVRDRTREESFERAEHWRALIESSELKNETFGACERESDWKGETRLKRFPEHWQEITEVLAAVNDLKPGQVAPQVFDTEYGFMILYRPEK